MFDRFFTGINYWASRNAIRMWRDFDEASAESDLQKLREVGITHLRVFPLWSDFQPLTAEYSYHGAYEYRFGDAPLPDTEAGRAGVSEEACENFRRFCRLADRYGMKLTVGLITGHMSGGVFAPPAFGGKNHVTDAAVVKWQMRFIRYFVTRFRREAAIVAWDLGNEVLGITDPKSYTSDEFYVWCSHIAAVIRSCDGTRPVLSGLDGPYDGVVEGGRGTPKEMAEICDVLTYHPYQIFQTADAPLCSPKPILDLAFQCRLNEDIGKKPAFAQEFGSIGYLNCSRKSEAAFYRASLLSTLAHGGHGVMWWCAFDQGQFDFPPYGWNNRGSDYGFFDRNGKAKPIAEENRKFKELLQKIPHGNLPGHRRDGVILVPRDDGDADRDALRAAFLLGKQANLDLGFSYALDPIPSAPLYLLPSLRRAMSIPKNRLEELLGRVREGAVLYVSLGTGFFRNVTELFGVTFSAREQIRREKILVMEDSELPVTAEAVFTVESVEGEIVARDRDGEPLFFRHAYGEGWIYLLTLPLEKYLAATPGSFHREDRPDYGSVYRELGKAAGIRRIVTSSDPFVLLTEHEIAPGEQYVFAINYSDRPRKTRLTFPKNCRIQRIFGAELLDGEATLPPCDGALYLVTGAGC